MANHSQDFYRGLILRDERFNGSNATVSPPEQQGNPRVGEPQVTGGQGQMDLEATGYSTPEKKYDIRCVKPGYAKGEYYSARFAWKPQSEADTNYRGWFPYSDVTSASVWRTQLTGLIPNAWPNAITSRDGWVHYVYTEKHENTGIPGSEHTAVATLNPNTDTWSTVDLRVAVLDQINLQNLPSDILELPSGRLLVINTSGQVVYSDDSGANWASIQGEQADGTTGFGFKATDFPSGIDGFVRMHAVYHNGYITCVIEKHGRITEGGAGAVDHREIDHYVSKDFGLSWTLVERFQPEWDFSGLLGEGTSLAKVYDPQLAVDALGQVVLVYADKPDNADANRRLNYSRKRTPYARFADSNDFDKELVASSGNFILCTTPDKFLTVIRQLGHTDTEARSGKTIITQYDTRDMRAVYDNRNVGTIQNLSSSKQFELLLQDGASPSDWGMSKEVEHLNMSAATPYKGGILFWTVGYTEKEAGVNARPGRGAHVLITLGGYSNYDQIKLTDKGSVWLPTETPDQIAAHSSTLNALYSGTPTFKITEEGLEIEHTSTSSCRFTFNNVSWSTLAYGRVHPLNDAGTVAGDMTSMYVFISAMDCQVRIGKGEVQVWDMTATPDASISSIVTIPEGMLDWVVTVDAEDLTPWVMYKAPSDQTWTKIPTTGTMTSEIRGASFGSDGAGIKSLWLYTGANDRQNYPSAEWRKTNYHPARLHGNNFSLYPVYLNDGWSIESKGAVAFVGDHWTAQTDYGHAVRLMHPEIASSPRIDWRSTNDKSEVSIEWNPANGTDTRHLGGALGVHLQNINFKTAYFEGWDGAAWVTLGTVNTAEHFSGLKFARDGNILRPNPAVTHSADRYIKLEELKGCTAVIAPGTGSETRHNIDHNSEGSFSAKAGTAHDKPAEILIDGGVSSITATGDFEIWEDRATLIIRDQSTPYSKYRLRIPAQDTKDGLFKIGACVIGPLLVFGTDYSWGRSIAYDPNQEITTARAGDRIVEELGPIRRKVQFAWAEGWDARPIGGESDAANDWVSNFDTLNIGTSTGVAVRNDPFVMSGAMYRLRAAAEPTVYLPKIPHFPNFNQVQIMGRDRQIYGRIVSPVTQTSILGDEEESEVITINQIVIEEEV